MGSGETAPTSIKLHRELIAGASEPCMLDTPYGFQANADDLNAKIGAYFTESVGTPLTVGQWRRADDPIVDRERTLSLLARSTYAFAGPGSPSYALRQWLGTPIPEALGGILTRGGTVILGSAAAVTAGAHAIPVYEIYKVGVEPHWLEGLDLLGAFTGIKAAVIPHFDNAEGGRHDTRYCYLGQSRLESMEADLPRGAGVVGIDEHTAVIFDIESGRASVRGAGGLTLRINGEVRVISSGDDISIAEIVATFDNGDHRVSPGASVSSEHVPTATATEESSSQKPSLAADAQALHARFIERLGAGDSDGALTCCLELEQVIHDWSADTWQSDDIDTARRLLRSMLVELAAAATTGLADPRTTVGPIVDITLDLRARARSDKDFATADLVRDRLGEIGIEVRDTPDGQEWDLR